MLYQQSSLFIVFGADDLGSLRNDFFVLDITNWQWINDFKANGVYPVVTSQSSLTVTGNQKPTTPVSSTNLGSQSSSANTNNQTPIPFNYISTIYLMLGVMIVFSFM